MEDSRQKPKSTTGQFFAMCTQSINDIVNEGGRAEDVIGYMVLARHTPGRGVNRYRVSTAGANAIAARAGMTYRQAQKVLAWLQKHNFIDKPPIDTNKTKKVRHRWILRELDDESLVYLSHSLLDGVGQGKNNPPMSRIITKTPLNIGEGVPVKDAKLDSIMTLIHLYQNHDIADFGGVDPTTGIFRKWEHTDSIPVLEIYADDSVASYLSVQEIKGASMTMFTQFAEDALFYVDDPDLRDTRFWNAFHNLHRLGFLYEVLEIWSDDPIKNDDAELLYPLYIFDKHARDSEPFLSKIIHKALIENIEVNAIPSFFEEIQFHRPSKEIQFRYAIPRNGGYPLSVYRLRFRPKTRDTAIGIDMEWKRADSWKEVINRISLG